MAGMPQTSLIALDWGSTSFRAYRLGPEGAVLETRSSERGITGVTDGDFGRVLREEAGDWLQPGLPVLAGGMITSRNGWVETPYVACPAGLDEIAAGVVTRELEGGVTLRFAPGLSASGAMPDVIRGEEVQIIGASAAMGDGLYVMRGTHCKWALVEGGRIADFATFVTGELYGALRKHTLVGRLAEGDARAPEAFARGVRFGFDPSASTGGLLHRMFSARTLGLFGELPPAELGDYLSGLLIGAEIREGLGLYGHAAGEGVVLIGKSELSERFAEAFAIAGGRTRAAPAEASPLGLWRIAQHLRLV